MERGIDKVRDAVRALVLFHPRQLTNHFYIPDDYADDQLIDNNYDSDGDEDKRIASLLASHEELRLADSVERLVTELTLVLSYGLRPQATLWQVLQTLTLLPQRCQAAMETHDASSHVVDSNNTNTSSATQREGTPSRSASHRFRFTAQLVHLVETTFAEQPSPVKARVLLRLALNQGCLVAALELLRRYNSAELRTYYETANGEGGGCLLLLQQSQDTQTAITTTITNECVNRNGTSGGGRDAEHAMNTKSHADAELWWPSFLAAVSLVGGTTLEALEQGAVLAASYLGFRLALFVPGVDAVLEDTQDSIASHRKANFHVLVQQYIESTNGKSETSTWQDECACEAPSAWRCFYLNALRSRARASRTTRRGNILCSVHEDKGNAVEPAADIYPRRLAVTVLPVNRSPHKSQARRARCQSTSSSINNNNIEASTYASSSSSVAVVVAASHTGNATPSVMSGTGCGAQSGVASRSTTHGPRGRRHRRRHRTGKTPQPAPCTPAAASSEIDITAESRSANATPTAAAALQAGEEDNASEIETNHAHPAVSTTTPPQQQDDDEHVNSIAAIDGKAQTCDVLVADGATQDEERDIERMLDELETLIARYHDCVTAVTGTDKTRTT